jgi:hypothetical protein
MAAPVGNKFWMQRSTHGRSPIFATPEDLWNACAEYFTWCEENPLYETQAFAYQGRVTQEPIPRMRAMTLSGLFVFLDINRTTWGEYAGREDFTAVTSCVEEIIRDQKFSGAAAGLLNANIIARDLGLKDTSAHEVTGKNGAPLQTVAMSKDEFRQIAQEVAEKF